MLKGLELADYFFQPFSYLLYSQLYQAEESKLLVVAYSMGVRSA